MERITLHKSETLEITAARGLSDRFITILSTRHEDGRCKVDCITLRLDEVARLEELAK